MSELEKFIIDCTKVINTCLNRESCDKCIHCENCNKLSESPISLKDMAMDIRDSIKTIGEMAENEQIKEI